MVKIARTVISGDVACVGHGGHRPELEKMADALSLFRLEPFPAVRSLIDGLD
jgi:hypothetical protein